MKELELKLKELKEDMEIAKDVDIEDYFILREKLTTIEEVIKILKGEN